MIETVLSRDPLLYYQPTQNQLKNLRFCSIKYANRVTYLCIMTLPGSNRFPSDALIWIIKQNGNALFTFW